MHEHGSNSRDDRHRRGPERARGRCPEGARSRPLAAMPCSHRRGRRLFRSADRRQAWQDPRQRDSRSPRCRGPVADEPRHQVQHRLGRKDVHGRRDRPARRPRAAAIRPAGRRNPRRAAGRRREGHGRSIAHPSVGPRRLSPDRESRCDPSRQDRDRSSSDRGRRRPFFRSGLPAGLFEFGLRRAWRDHRESQRAILCRLCPGQYLPAGRDDDGRSHRRGGAGDADDEAKPRRDERLHVRRRRSAAAGPARRAARRRPGGT